MSDDLISRNALLQRIEAAKGESKSIMEQFFFDGVMAIIDTQETAFDKEKVIEKIKNQLELSETYDYESDNPTDSAYYKGRALGHEIDIEIVEKGGIK